MSVCEIFEIRQELAIGFVVMVYTNSRSRYESSEHYNENIV